jgi:hypothetical protein
MLMVILNPSNDSVGNPNPHASGMGRSEQSKYSVTLYKLFRHIHVVDNYDVLHALLNQSTRKSKISLV